MRKLKQIEVILYGLRNGIPNYLLLKRTQERGGFWQPVTGGIQSNETLEQSLRRETFEETGIGRILEIIDLEFVFEFKKGPLFFIEYTYGAQVPLNSKITLSYEHDHHQWCTYNQAQRKLKWSGNKIALTKLNQQLQKQ